MTDLIDECIHYWKNQYPDAYVYYDADIFNFKLKVLMELRADKTKCSRTELDMLDLDRVNRDHAKCQMLAALHDCREGLFEKE